MAPSKTVIVKISKNGDDFEIFVNADMAYEYITGKRPDPMSVLENEEIFKDAREGERQSPEKIKKAFGTNELQKVIEAILKSGNVPITTEQRNKLTEEKRKQIINIIATNSIDPEDERAQPAHKSRERDGRGKGDIDPLKNATEQVDAVVKKISLIMPIKFTTAKMEVTFRRNSRTGLTACSRGTG